MAATRRVKTVDSLQVDGLQDLSGAPGAFKVPISDQRGKLDDWTSIPLLVSSGSINQNNTAASVDPAVTDDSSLGYGPGSIWVNQVTGLVFMCATNSVGAAVWVVVGQTATNMAGNVATSTVDTSTASTTDALVTGMTLTPPKGTYLVAFSGNSDFSIQITAVFSIYSGGVVEPSSPRRLSTPSTNHITPFVTFGVVTVDGAQAIEGRVRVDVGTITIHERSLMLLRRIA